nr:RNA-dependent RNA polymerase [Sarcosphaera coronaria partitivirus]
MKFPNLSITGIFPSLAQKIRDHTEPPAQIRTYDTIVRRALQDHLLPEEVETVLEGHRRSEWSPEAFEYNIQLLDNDYHEVIKDDHYNHAIEYIKDTYFTPEVPLQPVHVADLRKYNWELSTNVGAPYNTSKRWKHYVQAKWEHQQYGTPLPDPEMRDLFAEAHEGQSLEPKMVDARMSKRNLYNEIFYRHREHIHRIKEGYTSTRSGHDYKYWNVAFARTYTVKKDDPDKVRLVFGAPWLLLQVEMMFVWPIQTWLMSRNTKSPLLWGFETLTGGWYRLRNYFATHFPRFTTTLTIDFSGFDRYARHTVINDIHTRILRPMFDFQHGYHPTHLYPLSNTQTYTPERIENLWNWMTKAITDTPLLMPDGRLYKFNHSGIFSGYLQTQLLDSIYNMVMIYTILFRLGFKPHQIALKVQGDDSIIRLLAIFALIGHWLLDMFSHYATVYFGAKVSQKKSEILEGLDNAEVLKYRNRKGLPYRDSLMLLAQLAYPERSRSLSQLKARVIGIAYANCGSDPRVYRICEQIYQYLHFVEDVDFKGLPDQIKFIKKYIRQDFVDLTRFPSYLETVNHLLDERTPLPSKKYWPLNHFIGLPGQAKPA